LMKPNATASDKLLQFMDEHKVWMAERFLEYRQILERADAFRKKKIDECDEILSKP